MSNAHFRLPGSAQLVLAPTSTIHGKYLCEKYRGICELSVYHAYKSSMLFVIAEMSMLSPAGCDSQLPVLPCSDREYYPG